MKRTHHLNGLASTTFPIYCFCLAEFSLRPNNVSLQLDNDSYSSWDKKKMEMSTPAVCKRMHKCMHAVRYKSDASRLAIVRAWSVLTRMIAFLSFSLRLFVYFFFVRPLSIIIIAYCFFRSANWYALLYEKVLFHCSLSYPPGRVFFRDFPLFIFQYSFFYFPYRTIQENVEQENNRDALWCGVPRNMSTSFITHCRTVQIFI